MSAASGGSVPGKREVESYLRVWRETLSAVLGQIAAQDLALQDAAATDAAGAARPAEIFFNITLAGALRGEQSLGLTAERGRWLAAAFMEELPPEEAAAPQEHVVLSQEQIETLEELFRQVIGRVVTDLKAVWGEVQIHVASGGAPPWPAATTAWFATPEGATAALAVELRISAALAAALAATRRPSQASTAGEAGSPAALPLATVASLGAGVAAPATSSGPTSGTSGPSVSGTWETPAPGAVNLEFLKNVPLDLTLRFGQRRMVLREILELGPGSVIELDRRLKEPVDLLLDGQVLARGEVVVVQGCYGLRITQIAARGGEER